MEINYLSEDYIQEMLNNMNIVRTAIREKHPEPKKDGKYIEDTIPCPICKTGTVNYSIADHYNGHIHAHCSTDNCVSWME